MPVLSPCEDVKSLIERMAGIQIVGKPSRVRGVLEYHSSCPFCGGTDRFITRPETGQYTCATRAKGCGRHGDMLDFLTRDWASMTMREAIEEIGLDPDDLDFIIAERDEERTLARVAPPCKEWQESGRTWIHVFRMRRTLVNAPFALEYVHARGLTDESIDKFDIQYIPLAASGSWLVDKEPEKWGLSPAECPEENTEEGVKHVVKLPEGILIPWYAEGHLWKLEVRRLTDAKPYAKYMCVQGGQDIILFNLDAIVPGKPVVLVESAFCAILGNQIAGELAVFVATGGAKKAQEERFVKLLSQASCVLVGFDDDEPDSEGKRAGDEGAKYWKEHLPNALRWTPRPHDINDMLREEQDIQKWVTRGLRAYERVAKARSLLVTPMPVPAMPAVPEPLPLQGPSLDEYNACAICQTSLPIAKRLFIQTGEEGELYYYCANCRPDLAERREHMLKFFEKTGKEFEAASQFYDAFCSRPGYHLRLRDDGLIGIIAPVTDEEYENIVTEVCAQGESLLQVLRECPNVPTSAVVETDEAAFSIPVYDMPHADYLAMIQKEVLEQRRQELRTSLKSCSPVSLPPHPRKQARLIAERHRKEAVVQAERARQKAALFAQLKADTGRRVKEERERDEAAGTKKCLDHWYTLAVPGSDYCERCIAFQGARTLDEIAAELVALRESRTEPMLIPEIQTIEERLAKEPKSYQIEQTKSQTDAQEVIESLLGEIQAKYRKTARHGISTQMWVAPGTGYEQYELITYSDYRTRIAKIVKSEDEKRINAAIDAMKRSLYGRDVAD